MANISGSGAPNKRTIGSVGDIYTNENTSEQYECVAVYKLRTHKGIVTEYDWDLIIYTNTGEGGGGSGVSPTITVTEINGGHRLRITDVNGAKSFDVMDGEVGPQGSQGIQGENAVSAINPRGDYDVSADPSYTVSDYITHTDGNTYVCKVDNPTNIAPVDGTADDPYWQLLALRGATGPQGIQGFPGERGVDGNDGVGIAKVEKIATDDLVDTYQITFTDGTHFEYQITNGADGAAGSGADIEIDSEMSDTSTNPVQNAVVKKYIDGKGITVSAEADNAIEKKADGIYVADRSAEIDAMSDKVAGISEYRKYINTELEYCYLAGSATVTYTGTGSISDNPIFVETHTISGNMEITADKYVVLKAGKTYHVNGTLRAATDTVTNYAIVGYNLRDVDSDGNLLANGYSYVNSHLIQGRYTSKDLLGFITPTQDINVTLAIVEVSGFLNNYSFGVTIQEVGRQITIDPLEHANSTDGIEDAPVGHIISFMGNKAPAHYLTCDGSTYNIADYPYLTQHFIDEFGSANYFGGDGVATFAVPDLRGEFLRGTGTATRNRGTGADVGIHQEPTWHHMIYKNGTSNFVRFYGTDSDNNKNRDAHYNYASGDDTSVTDATALKGEKFTSTAVIPYYSSRPTNTSVLYCIKYEPTYFMQNTYIGNEEVVLYEGNTKVECSTSLVNPNIDVVLADAINNYDEIKIYYGTYSSSSTITSHRCAELDIQTAINGVVIWLPIIWSSFAMSICIKFTEPNMFEINNSRIHSSEQLTSTALGINIYRIVGYRTSLTEHGQYTDEEITSLVDEIWSE